MAVAFDAVGPSSSGQVGSNVSSMSWTHTPVGTPTAVAVCVGFYTNAHTITGITYGGVAMTQAKLQASTGVGAAESVAIWGLPNPTSGAQSVVVTFNTGGNFAVGCSVSVTGSSTSTCFSNTSGANGTGTTASTTCTSATGELVVDIMLTDDGTTGVTISAAGGQTQRMGTAQVGTTESVASSTAPGAATVAMSETWTGSKPWAIAAASFLAAGGGSTRPVKMAGDFGGYANGGGGFAG